MAINLNHTGAGSIILRSDAADQLKVNNYRVYHEGFQGAASGLDADLLDGQHGSYYTNASNLNAGSVPSAQISQGSVTQHQAALTIAESQITDGTVLARVGGTETITALWTFNTLPQSAVAPTNANDLINKSYADALIQGLKHKQSVRFVTTTNITLAGGAPNTYDGVTLAVNDRAVVAGQTTQAENGLYIVQTLGTGSNGTWVRASDGDSWTELVSAFVTVEEGTAKADSRWLCLANAGGTLGSTAVVWQEQTNSSYIGGNGINIAGATVSVVSANSGRIAVSGSGVDLATIGGLSTGSFGSASQVATYTVDAYGRITTSGQTSIQITESQVTDGTLLARVGGTETITAAWTYNVAPIIAASDIRLGSSTKSDTKRVLSLANGQFAANGDADVGMYILRCSTANATITDLTTDGAVASGTNTMVLPNDTSWMFRIVVVARRTDVDGETASYEYIGAIDRNASAASTALVGSVMESVYAEDSTPWTITISAETTNGALRIQATGEAAKTIRWVAYVQVTEVTG